MNNPSNPSSPSPAVLRMSQPWEMIDALMGGTETMRAAGPRFLPKNTAEPSEAYQRRLAASFLFNGYRRAIETLSGKPFSQPLQLGDDVPELLVEYAKDIDLQGRNLHAFAHDVFRTALSHGLSHILVDHPKVPTLPDGKSHTLADQRAAGRPYFVHLHPDAMLGWRSERINGVETLTQLRFLETIEEPDPVNEWATKEIKQVRVIEPNAWRIYRKGQDDKWLATVYGQRTGFMTARPPLLDLAWLNVEHWQSASDQSNILHVARVPILFASGFESTDPITVGAGIAVTTDDPNANLRYVEHQGAAIEAGRQSLKDLEERMSLLGGLLLTQKPGMKTATEKAIETAEAESSLGLMALNLQDALDLALDYAAKWEGIITGGGTVKVFTDFGKADAGGV